MKKVSRIFVILISVFFFTAGCMTLRSPIVFDEKKTVGPITPAEVKGVETLPPSESPPPVVTGLEIADTWTFVYLGENPTKPAQSYAGKLCYMGEGWTERQIVGYNGADEDGVQQHMVDYVMNLKPEWAPKKVHDTMGTYKLFGGEGAQKVASPDPARVEEPRAEKPEKTLAADSPYFTRVSGFAKGKADLSEEIKKDLENAVLHLRENGFEPTSIEGYADIRGVEEGNAGLSERRANTASGYLESVKHLNLSSLPAEGMGRTARFGRYEENRCVLVVGTPKAKIEAKLINDAVKCGKKAALTNAANGASLSVVRTAAVSSAQNFVLSNGGTEKMAEEAAERAEAAAVRIADAAN